MRLAILSATAALLWSLVPGVAGAQPQPVSSCEELQSMNGDLTKSYVLTQDIDCTFATRDPAGSLWNGGQGFLPIEAPDWPGGQGFTGDFDGGGHSITGLTINRPPPQAALAPPPGCSGASADPPSRSSPGSKPVCTM